MLAVDYRGIPASECVVESPKWWAIRELTAPLQEVSIVEIEIACMALAPFAQELGEIVGASCLDVGSVVPPVHPGCYVRKIISPATETGLISRALLRFWAGLSDYELQEDPRVRSLLEATDAVSEAFVFSNRERVHEFRSLYARGSVEPEIVGAGEHETLIRYADEWFLVLSAPRIAAVARERLQAHSRKILRAFVENATFFQNYLKLHQAVARGEPWALRTVLDQRGMVDSVLLGRGMQILEIHRDEQIWCLRVRFGAAARSR